VEMMQKNSHKCPCVLKTKLNKKEKKKLIIIIHNHLPGQNETRTAKIKMQIKRQAYFSKSTPAQLFLESVMGLLESVLEELLKKTP